jgi:protein-tyrosine phosphatase
LQRLALIRCIMPRIFTRDASIVIDLHCHLLPGLDDGPRDIAVSLAMARIAVAEGTEILACTPHILPGLYHNSGFAIREATARLQTILNEQLIPLKLVPGADVHVCPDFAARLRSGKLLSLADSRYVLIEPPHYTAPPQLEGFFFHLMGNGYVPILTHPERLAWLPPRYEMVQRLARSGVWMQVTASSFTGAFGRSALYWAERMLDEGYVHLIATDAHDVELRPPDLAKGREAVAKRVGAPEAHCLVVTRPLGILNDEPPSSLPQPLGVADVDSARTAAQADQKSLQDDTRQRSDCAERVGGLSRRLRQLFK